MRIDNLLLALAALSALGCAELATLAPSVTIDLAARQRVDDAGERWSWAIGGRLGTRLDLAARSGAPEGDDVWPDAAGTDGAAAVPALGCRVAPLCVWEARARARALARARAACAEEEP